MFWYLLVTAALACTSAAPTSEMPVNRGVQDSIAMCVVNVISWCDGTKIPTKSMADTIVSNNPHIHYDLKYSLLCTENPQFGYNPLAGVNCTNNTNNGEPWFSCSDNEVFYKGKKQDPQDTSYAVRLCETTYEWDFND